MRSVMNMKTILLAFLALTSVASAQSGPTIELQSDRVQVRGIAAGEQVVWTALVREDRGHYESTRVVRGTGTANARGELSIDEVLPSKTRTQWLFSILGDKGSGQTLRAGTNGEAEPDEVVISATPGAAFVLVEAAALDFIYIHNGFAHYFFGADGGDFDADGEQNGVIKVVLASLKKFPMHDSDPPPPANVQSGDKILVIDVYELRNGSRVVSQ